jgi:hypothetical protein
MQLAHGDDGGGVAGIKLRYGEALEEGGMRGWQRGEGGRGRTDAAEGPRWVAIHATACGGSEAAVDLT